MAQDSTAFMRSIDADYRAATGLTERRFYTIFHSRIEPCPVMIIGYNPAGNPAQWTESTRSTASAVILRKWRA